MARISDAGVAKIKGLSRLEDLQLGKSHVGDASLAIIAGLTKLKTLDLQSTRVTDAGMVHLKPLAKLNGCASRIRRSPTPAWQLKGLTQLCDLYLSDGPITEAGLKSLRDALPTFTFTAETAAATSPLFRPIRCSPFPTSASNMASTSNKTSDSRPSPPHLRRRGNLANDRRCPRQFPHADGRGADGRAAQAYKHDCQRDMASMLFNDPRARPRASDSS